MMDAEIEPLAQRYLDGTITAEEMRVLNARLKENADARREFSDLLNLDTAIADAALRRGVDPILAPEYLTRKTRRETERPQPGPDLTSSRRRLVGIRPSLRYRLTAAGVGLLLGIFGTRWVSAFVSPGAAATVERLTTLLDAGFESSIGRIPSGFPRESGIWGGDHAEVVPLPTNLHHEGGHALRFVQPGADAGNPNGRAISCDVFQIVDLRPLRASIRDGSDAVLELSADFLDARQEMGLSITFMCQIFLFPGKAESLHEVWPLNLGGALGSGSGSYDSGGGAGREWKTLSARCLLNSKADFAVVQLGARPNGPERELSRQYVDRVQLSLKVQPRLPIRNIKP